jgi:hypothetical protein
MQVSASHTGTQTTRARHCVSPSSQVAAKTLSMKSSWVPSAFASSSQASNDCTVVENFSV